MNKHLMKHNLDGGERRKLKKDFFIELEKRWNGAIPIIQEKLKESGIERSAAEIKEMFDPSKNRIIQEKLLDGYIKDGIKGIPEEYMKKEKELEVNINESNRDGESN